jgi:hypothetical protein
MLRIRDAKLAIRKYHVTVGCIYGFIAVNLAVCVIKPQNGDSS